MIALREDSPEECAPHQKTPLPAERRNHFKGGRLMAPDKGTSPFTLPPEELLIFAGKACRIKWTLILLEQISFEEDIPGAALAPMQWRASAVNRTTVEAAFYNPTRRSVIEVWIYWT